jgi:hypothetical protein
MRLVSEQSTSQKCPCTNNTLIKGQLVIFDFFEPINSKSSTYAYTQHIHIVVLTYNNCIYRRYMITSSLNLQQDQQHKLNCGVAPKCYMCHLMQTLSDK